MINRYEPDIIMLDDGIQYACVKDMAQDGKVIVRSAIPDAITQIQDEDVLKEELKEIAQKLISLVQNMDVTDGKVIDI